MGEEGWIGGDWGECGCEVESGGGEGVRSSKSDPSLEFN